MMIHSTRTTMTPRMTQPVVDIAGLLGNELRDGEREAATPNLVLDGDGWNVAARRRLAAAARSRGQVIQNNVKSALLAEGRTGGGGTPAPGLEPFVAIRVAAARGLGDDSLLRAQFGPDAAFADLGMRQHARIDAERGSRCEKWHQSGSTIGQAQSCGQGATTCAPCAMRWVRSERMRANPAGVPG